MKKKFIKFFEIGKLERGLLRVWIVLSVVWVVSTYIFYSSQYEVENHKYLSYASSKPDIYCKPQYKKIRVPFETNGSTFWILKSTDKVVWGHQDIFNEGRKGLLRYDVKNLFDSRDKCISFYKAKKNSAYKEAFSYYLIIFLTPFLIPIFYLFSKKVFFWVRRGFK